MLLQLCMNPKGAIIVLGIGYSIIAAIIKNDAITKICNVLVTICGILLAFIG